MAEKIVSAEGLKNKIIKVIKGSKLASLATVVNGKPWVRYVVARSEGLTIYICTFKDSRKVRQMQKTLMCILPLAGVWRIWKLLMFRLRLVPRRALDAGIRKKLWVPFMRKYYTGVDDPQYVVIEAKPVLIEYMSTESHTPQIYKVGKGKVALV